MTTLSAVGVASYHYDGHYVVVAEDIAEKYSSKVIIHKYLFS